MTTQTRLLTAITREIGAIDIAENAPDTVLNLDSIGKIQTAMAAEDEFGVTITDDEIEALPDPLTLRDVLQLVERKLDR